MPALRGGVLAVLDVLHETGGDPKPADWAALAGLPYDLICSYQDRFWNANAQATGGLHVDD